MNREQWIEAAVRRLAQDPFAKNGFALNADAIRVACGWPSSRSTVARRKTLGECWPRARSANGVNEIFISPILSDPVRVLEVLLHELVHAYDDCISGHRREFIRVARTVGLLPPWSATKASDELRGRLRVVADELGPYPHAAVTPVAAGSQQKTYLLKAECVKPTCGAVFRITRFWLERAQNLQCPVCGSTAEVKR